MALLAVDVETARYRTRRVTGSALSIGLFLTLTQPWPDSQAYLQRYIAILMAAGLILWTINLAFSLSSQLRAATTAATWRLIIPAMIGEYVYLIVASVAALALIKIPTWVGQSTFRTVLVDGSFRGLSSIILLAGMGIFLAVFLWSLRSGERIEFQSQWGGLGGGGGGWRVSTPAVCIVVFLMLALAWGLTQLQVKPQTSEAGNTARITDVSVSTAGGKSQPATPNPSASSATEKKE